MKPLGKKAIRRIVYKHIANCDVSGCFYCAMFSMQYLSEGPRIKARMLKVLEAKKVLLDKEKAP